MSSFYPNGDPHAPSIFKEVPDEPISTYFNGIADEIIAREVALRAENSLINLIFKDSGQITQGALQYNQLTDEQLQSLSEAAERQPGEEFAMVFQPEANLQSEKVRQFGAKTEITYEAVRRNDRNEYDAMLTFLALTIGRKLDDYVLDILDKVKDAGLINEATIDVSPITRNTPIGETFIGDVVEIAAMASEGEFSVGYDMLILRPQMATWMRFQEKTTGIDLEQDFGIKTVTNNALPKDTGYLIDSSKVGEVYWEDGLTTETFDDKTRHVHIAQAWASPAAAVTMPKAIMHMDIQFKATKEK